MIFGNMATYKSNAITGVLIRYPASPSCTAIRCNRIND